MATQRKNQRSRVELTENKADAPVITGHIKPVNRLIPVSKIKSNPANPRAKQGFNEKSLAADLSRFAMQTGTLQIPPVVVMELDDDNVMLLQGERRTLAVREMKRDPETYPVPPGIDLDHLPAIVFPANISQELQEELLHDHGRSEGLKRVAVAELFWELLPKGNPSAVGFKIWRTIRDSFLADKTRKSLDEAVEKANTPSAFREAICGANGRLRNQIYYLGTAYDFGPRGRNGVRKALGATEGFEKLPGETELPVADKVDALTIDHFRRDGMLSQAKEKDIASGNWDAEKFTGPETEKVFAAIAKGEGPTKNITGKQLADFAKKQTPSVKAILENLHDVTKTSEPVMVDAIPAMEKAMDRVSWADTVFPLLEKHRKDKTYGEFIVLLLDNPEKLSDFFGGKGK